MQSGAAFESTNWSMLLAAQGGDNPRVLDALLRRYVAPIYTYIRRAGRTADEAADLTQEFIAQVMLERGLIDRADPTRGRFRTFVKAALGRFLVDQHRRATARTRRPASPPIGGLRLEELERGGGVGGGDGDPGAAFDRQWAATVLATALERVEADCRCCGQQTHWAAFTAAILEPALRQTVAPPLEELARRLGVGSGAGVGEGGGDAASQVSSLIQTVRRKFRRTVRKVIEETVADPAAAEEELRDLKAFLEL